MITEELGLAVAVCRRVAELLGRAPESISVDSNLADLAVDSIDLVEVAIDLQEEHDVWFEESDLAAVEKISDLVALIERRKAEAGAA